MAGNSARHQATSRRRCVPQVVCCGRAGRADEFALTLQVPNSIYQFWIESNYSNVVRSVATSVLGSPREIKFCDADSAMTGAAVSFDKVSETPILPSQDEDSEDALYHGMISELRLVRRQTSIGVDDILSWREFVCIQPTKKSRSVPDNGHIGVASLNLRLLQNLD
jgi:hypothetical protein